MSKVQSLSGLVRICQKLKDKGKTVGLVSGCFDLLHPGHINLLRFAKKNVDVLLVGLESDEAVGAFKGKDRPIFKFEERAIVLTELESVDYIFRMPKILKFYPIKTPPIYEKEIKRLKPDVLITTSGVDNFGQHKKRDAKKIGARLLLFKQVAPFSSSWLIEKLKKV